MDLLCSQIIETWQDWRLGNWNPPPTTESSEKRSFSSPFPLKIQYLPKDQNLIAETPANRSPRVASKV